MKIIGQVAGIGIMALGALLWLGNVVGFLPTVPFVGYLTFVAGGWLYGWASRQGRRPVPVHHWGYTPAPNPQPAGAYGAASPDHGAAAASTAVMPGAPTHIQVPTADGRVLLMSPDRRWWWDGFRWTDVRVAAPPSPVLPGH